MTNEISTISVSKITRLYCIFIAGEIDIDRITDMPSVTAFKDRLNEVLDLLGCANVARIAASGSRDFGDLI
jgi:hypothetical protein